jgi:DNA-binding MarR family transcriptional regulator
MASTSESGGAADAQVDRGSLLHRLLKLTNRLMAPFSTHLATRHQISLNEFRMLMTLGRYGTRASHELADQTGVNAMSVSRAVTALERRGWIRVETDPANRRRKVLDLTKEGASLYKTMRPQSDRVADYLLSRLSAADIEALDRIVDTLIETLEETDEEGNSVFLEQTRPPEKGPSE